MKMASLFLGGGGGGGGGGVRGSRNLGGGSASFKLSTTKDSNDMQLSYSVTPPPRVSGSAPACRASNACAPE